ncbi:MAG: hypothetical protein ABI405_04990 [Parafilimonas sp.]
MRKLFLLVMVILSVASCKNSKTDLSGTEKISAEDFIKAFPEIDLPVSIADTGLKNFGDTVVISKTVFAEFIPDTAFAKFLGKANAAVIIHPAGIIHKKEMYYLLAKFSSSRKIQLAVFLLDEKHKFLASLPLLNNSDNDKYDHSVSITEEPAFIRKRAKFTADNKSLYSRNGFAYSASLNSFAEVLHDSNEDTARNNEIINPIDTLPATNKYSADYGTDKKNFISVRDGKNAVTYSFFIHFDKNNGDCVGELKGMMTLTDEKNAVFTESGDPCVIDFKFAKNTIQIKEQNNCGNHRGITCPFDFTFKKKNQINNQHK